MESRDRYGADPGSRRRGLVLCQPSFSGIGLTVGNGLAAADDARSFIGSDRAKPDTAKSAHHAIEPRHTTRACLQWVCRRATWSPVSPEGTAWQRPAMPAAASRSFIEKLHREASSVPMAHRAIVRWSDVSGRLCKHALEQRTEVIPASGLIHRFAAAGPPRCKYGVRSVADPYETGTSSENCSCISIAITFLKSSRCGSIACAPGRRYRPPIDTMFCPDQAGHSRSTRRLVLLPRPVDRSICHDRIPRQVPDDGIDERRRVRRDTTRATIQVPDDW